MTRNEMNTLKMNILGGMHEYVRHIKDEDAYDLWITCGVPDEPDEEDLEFIAENHEEFADCVKLFAKIVKHYVKKDSDEYVE